MIRTLRWLLPVPVCGLALSFGTSGEGKKFSIKTVATPVPKFVESPRPQTR